MLEGEGSVQSGGSGSEDVAGSAANSSGLESSNTGPAVATGGAASLASGEGGSAPAFSGDAASTVGAPVPTAAQAPGEYAFAGRKWESQRAAENAHRLALSRAAEAQRRAAELERAIAERDAAFQQQRPLGNDPTAGQRVQGAVRGQDDVGDASRPFAERLAQSGNLDFLTSLLETREGEDPTTGIKRFTLGLADMISKEVDQRVDGFRSQHFEPMLRQQQFERHMGSTMGVVRQLAGEFSELDESNQSPEAQEHQQAFVENLKQFPPEFVRENPQFAMLATALVTRYQHGTPVFSQMPGTSGSPSARLIQASEQGFGAAAGSPLSGTGTPRPRPNGAGETAEDRMRRENAGVSLSFKSPSGRDLGFGPA